MTTVASQLQVGLKRHQEGDIAAAEQVYRSILAIEPDHAGAWHLLGLVSFAKKQHQQAKTQIQRALAVCDSKAVYWNNYGAVLKELGDFAGATAAFEKAIGIRDDYPDAWANLGLMQMRRGETERADASLRYALRWQPRHRDAIRHLAALCLERGDFEEALRLCRDAQAVAPGTAEIYNTEGGVLASLKRFDEAAEAFRKALAIDPAFADSHLNLGFVYADLNEFEKAGASFCQAAVLRPDRPLWRLRHLGICPVVFQDTAEIAGYRTTLETQLDEVLADPPAVDWRYALRDGFMPSFQLSHHGVCNRRIKEKFAGVFAPHFPRERPKPTRRKKIRVGFACTRPHEGGFIRGFGGVMERLNRRRFEVVGLVSDGLAETCRSRVPSADVSWISFPNHIERALRVFHDAECDVVVHWTPGTDLVNYFLPFLPLAPVQCIGFGMHGTTGIGSIDYCVSSRLFERGVEAAEDYTEKLLLFESATSWQTRPRPAGPSSRADFGLPQSGPLYFCPQRLAKFHPDFDRVLRAILERDAMGRIVILAGGQHRPAELLKARFERAMGSSLARRVLFLPSQNSENYMRLLAVMDVVLDMPTYSAALTGYDTFAAGVPIVTQPGRHMVERYALGLYRQMGMSDLIAWSEADYIDLAVKLGRQPDFRREMSEEINRRSDVLFEDVTVIREYESFFESVVQ